MRLCAPAHRHRRGKRRQCARSGRLSLREPRQRHRAQPRADRARERASSRGDARRDLRPPRGVHAVLKLRRGIVVSVKPDEGAFQDLDVEVDGETRPAKADIRLVGRCGEGDEVVVNVEALDLMLGSGGFDLVHVNLARGLVGEGTAGAHVMKLNYTSLQHSVLPVESERSPSVGNFPPVDSVARSLDQPVGVIFLHGQLPPVAWAAAQAAPGKKVGFVQTVGGALPGGLSNVARSLRERDLLAGHITAGMAYGGEGEAITTIGAIHHGLRDLGWDAVICGPGPGILGSGSALGHGGMIAMDSLHTAAALGCRPGVIARMSSGDPRKRHQGLSHHTRTVLSLLLAQAVVGTPTGERVSTDDRHEWRVVDTDVDAYAATGLPATTMGRTLEQDRAFFSAAIAG